MKLEVDHDPTVKTFTNWLAEMKVQNNRTVQEILSETSIIRDSITANNMELTDFKRHSSSISQQMQSQLTDLREKLTTAFGEITALVKQKTQSDSEMMQDVNTLQQNLSQKTYELEALNKSYSQAHQHLQSSLIQMQNHLQVSKAEVSTAKTNCERVHREGATRFAQIEQNIKTMTEDYTRGTTEVRSQMRQLKDEIARIQQSVTAVCSDFEDHKRASTAIHNKLQAQVWTVEEAKKQEAAGSPSHVSQKSYQPLVTMTASQGSLMHPGTGSVQVPQPMLHHGTSPRRSPSLPQPISPQSMSGPVVIPGQYHQVPNTVRTCWYSDLAINKRDRVIVIKDPFVRHASGPSGPCGPCGPAASGCDDASASSPLSPGSCGSSADCSAAVRDHALRWHEDMGKP